MVRSIAAMSFEAECLPLGIKSPVSLLNLDDLAARDAASANRIAFNGPLGCPTLAKTRNLIPASRH